MDQFNTYTNQDESRIKFLRRLTLAVGVLIILFIAYNIYLSTKFHIVSTSPKTSQAPSVTTFFKVNFNKDLASGSASVSSQPSIVTTTSISGKTLTINLRNPATLDTNTTYTITINDIADTSGSHLTDKELIFKPVAANSQDISAQQQQAQLKKQTNKPPSAGAVTDPGLDTLLNYGLSTTQEFGLQQAFYKFNSNTGATLDPSSISVVPHDPNSASTVNTIDCMFTINNVTYKATVNYSNISDVELYLYDSTGAQVFDSGLIDGSST